MRFIKPKDYRGVIKPEILKQITGTTDVNDPSEDQVTAEDTAMATVRNYIGGKYDCDAIFTPWDGTGTDTRDLHMVAVVVKLALWHLYQQTGTSNVPEHRQTAYDDAIQWLKDVGRGTIQSILPQLEGDGYVAEVRLNSEQMPRNRW